MKGLYVIWPDTGYLDEAVNAGIDTLIIAFYNLPGRIENPLFDSFNTNVSIMERYKNKVRILACPLLFASWSPVESGHRFISGGKEYPNIWCPMSRLYIDTFFAPFQDLRIKGLCHGIIYDPEPVTGSPFIYADLTRCECDRCRNHNAEDQWAYRASIFKRDKFNVGQLLCQSKWSLQCYDSPVLLTEDTYGKCDCNHRWKMWLQRRRSGIDYTIVPGAFMEVHRSPGEFIEYLKYLKDRRPFDGYWIYSQKMLSRNSKMDETGIKELEKAYGYYERRLVNQVDENFFNKLRDLNK